MKNIDTYLKEFFLLIFPNYQRTFNYSYIVTLIQNSIVHYLNKKYAGLVTQLDGVSEVVVGSVVATVLDSGAI